MKKVRHVRISTMKCFPILPKYGEHYFLEEKLAHHTSFKLNYTEIISDASVVHIGKIVTVRRVILLSRFHSIRL